MVTRNRGRYVAPIAILIVIAVTVVIVQSELGSRHHARRHTANRINALARRSGPKAATSYVVKSGDSLSSISVKTGVSVPKLETLNPGVDPAALQTGQRLRLRQ
jgi:LysM repeat protein